MRINLYIVASFLVATTIYANEVSVYGAGDMSSKTPYGLTKNEQILFDKTKEIDKLNVDFTLLKQELSSVKEQLEGTRSVLEGTNNKIGRSDSELQGIDAKIVKVEESLQSFQKELDALKEQLNSSIKINEDNNKKITTALKELSSLIDSINNSYVSKKDLESFETQSEKKSENLQSELESKSGAELMKEARELADSNRLDDAKSRYLILLKKNYMPARNNFNLGEIAYKQEDWNNAIAYYKVSIELYDKADYIPKLQIGRAHV